MPGRDLLLAEVPAQEHLLAVPQRREVDEAEAEILHLDSERVNTLDAGGNRGSFLFDSGSGVRELARGEVAAVAGDVPEERGLASLSRRECAGTLDHLLHERAHRRERVVRLLACEDLCHQGTMIVAVVSARQRHGGESGHDTGRLIGWLVLALALATLSYASRLSAGKPDRDALYQWATFLGGVIQYAFVLGLLLLIARGGPARRLFALRQPRSWGRALGLALLVLIGTFVLAAALNPLLQAGEEQGLTPEGWDGSRAIPFLANFVVVAAFGPLVEELSFRGLGFSLLARFGQVAAILVSGLLFGLAHGLVEALPILTFFGIGLAFLRARSDSVFPCWVLHGIFNGLALIFSVTLVERE